jgi:hypothetical protein
VVGEVNQSLRQRLYVVHREIRILLLHASLLVQRALANDIF